MAALYGDDLAYVHHEAFGGLVRDAAPAILDRLKSAGLEEGTIVDLGCGSGPFAARAVEAGYDVLGIDPSPHFIGIARDTVPGARFECASSQDAALPDAVAVAALGEVLGYIAPGAAVPDPAAIFAKVSEALVDGGFFFFDLVVFEGGGLMRYRDWTSGADWAVLIDVDEDVAEATLTRQITVFREREGGYRRSHEVHKVRIFGRAEIVNLLSDCGLEVTVQPGYGEVPLAPRRLAFIARKNA